MSSPVEFYVLSSGDKDFSAVSYNKRVLSQHSNIVFKRIDFQKGANFNKLSNYRDFLNKLQEDSFVILIDATDVICINSDINKMYQDFSTMNLEIVFGAEKGTCYAFGFNSNQRIREDCELWHEIYNLGEVNFDEEKPVGRTWLKNPFLLNSGMMCGYAGSISNFLNDVINGATKGYIDDQKVNFYSKMSDQICITQTILKCKKYHKTISIDKESKLFHNIAPFKYDFVNQKISTANKTLNPYFIHFPGSCLMHSQIKQFKSSFGFVENSGLLDFNLISS